MVLGMKATALKVSLVDETCSRMASRRLNGTHQGSEEHAANTLEYFVLSKHHRQA
jgi:hypothetical protein